MGEILFRGLASNKKFVYGWLVQNIKPVGERMITGTMEIHQPYGDWNEEFEVYDDTVGQFTGLTDCDGVKIFEGDIFAGKSKVFGMILGAVCMSEYNDNEEYMHEKHFGLNVMGIPLIDLINDGLSIIGNIHQNPELLERTNANHN